MQRPYTAILVFLLCSAAAGCGNADDPGVKVTGSVTVGGSPQSNIIIGFVSTGSPTADKPFPKGARTDATGKFEATLPPGKYAVVLSKKVDASGNVPGPDADVGQLEADGQLRESLPEQYTDPATTPLAIDIPSEGKDLEPFVVQ